MLRAVLAGLFAVSATSACKSSDQAQVQATAAGKVVEVAGQVTVHGKPLAVGDTVGADDEIATGADGRAVIVLAHNGARWELGPNKTQKVAASIAWNLPKQDGNAKAVDQDTAAAGRPAERSAAETTTMAPEAQNAPAPPPPPTAQPAPPPRSTGGAAPVQTEEKAPLEPDDYAPPSGG